MTTKAIACLTPDVWEKAKSVLLGEDPNHVSMSAAARKAGVTLQTLNGWIRRSREKRVTDEPWIHEIAELVDQRGFAQADTLEDVAWQRAIGTEKQVWHRGEVVGTDVVWDNKVMMTMLGARNPAYRQDKNNVTIKMDAGEMMQRLEAVIRLARAEEARIVDGQSERLPDTADDMAYDVVKPQILPDDNEDVELE